jgi:phage gp46-like protein
VSEETIYTGDLLLSQIEEDGELDIEFVNGQPKMTNFLETLVIMYVLGEDWWGNDLVDSESQKMKSKFPGIIKRAVVSDDTLKNGTEAIKEALQPIITEELATEINVVGEIINIFAIGWEIEIKTALESIKYFINWENGFLKFQKV